MDQLQNKKCKICGKDFSEKENTKYCSLKCRNRDYKGKHFSIKTEFKEGQKFSKKRNQKISNTHQKNHKNIKRIDLICFTCKKIFSVIPSKKYRKFCSQKCYGINPKTRANMSRRMRGCKFSKNRNKKISQKLKGKIPKNLITNVKRNNSYPQNKMYEIIKKYFSSARLNYYVKTNTKRFLDVAIPELMIDFEYNGKIHLMKSVQENDKKRTKELKNLGWNLIIIDRFNFNEVENIVQQLFALLILENGDLR